MVSILDLCSHLGLPLKREGRVYKTLSPWRPERNPSFTIYPETNSFYDFGSCEGGGVLTFVQKYFGCSRKEAVEKLKSLKVKVSTKPVPLALVPSKRVDLTEVYNNVARIPCFYFSVKGIPSPPEEYFRTILYKKKYWLAFPLPTPQKMKGLELKRLTEFGTEYQPKERITLGKKLPWVYQTDSSVWLVTESITDCLAGWKYFGNVSLLSLNGVGNVKYLSYLKNKKPSKVILALDNDPPGRDATSKALEITEKFAKTECFVYPNGCKDLQEILKR